MIFTLGNFLKISLIARRCFFLLLSAIDEAKGVTIPTLLDKKFIRNWNECGSNRQKIVILGA